MAVWKRVYQPLPSGDLTPRWSRFLVLPRHARAGLGTSRLLTGYLVLCLVPVLVAAALIYVYNNPIAQALLGVNDPGRWGFRIDGSFFYWVLNIQGNLVFLLIGWVGPGLVAPDLVNNALPLYLSRPFTRTQYVIGRLATLFFLASLVSWVPDLLLWGLQAALAGQGWWRDNLSIAGGIVAGALIGITVLSLLALALSAWVRWRIVATGLYVGLFLALAGLGEAFNQALRTRWGSLLNFGYDLTAVWRDLLGVAVADRQRRMQVGDPTADDLPVGWCWVVMLALSLLCLLLLSRRLRAKEVVRG
jgi:ABC-2 type transport system permease protein